MREDRTVGDAIESQWLGQNGIATGTWANSVGLEEHNRGQSYGGGGAQSPSASLGILVGIPAAIYAMTQGHDLIVATIAFFVVAVTVAIIAEAFHDMSQAITMVSILSAVGAGGWTFYNNTDDWLTALIVGIIAGAGVSITLGGLWMVARWFAGTRVGRIVLWPFVMLWKALKLAVGLAVLGAIGYGVALFAGWV